MLLAALLVLSTTICPQHAADSVALGETSSPSLECLVLVPTPDLMHASGTVALLPAESPFGVAATVDGRPRQHLVATLAGLPDPRTLGDYTVYIAWATTLALDSVVKLGRVRNGRTDLGELDYVQYRLLISAERSDTVTERHGRLVLRGTSPSARLLTHRDLLQPSAPGALLDSARSTNDTMRRSTALVWSMPPMPSWMPMMPTMAGITPLDEPYLPAAGADSSTMLPPAAVPGSTVRLSAGDTIDLEAGLVRRTIDGHVLSMFAFNGQQPGPMLEVPAGATITVRFHNALDLPSSVHWHGVRLDNRFDGAVGVTQDAVPPGGRFVYTVHFPDAGLYWYHPHVREDIEQHLGLYGNILVQPASDPYEPVNDDAVLLLSDLLLGHGGLSPFGRDVPTHALMGRWGNVLLVNGEPGYHLRVSRGDVVRFFITNASSARLYNLSFDGGGARLKVVGGDIGRFEHEAWVPSVVIAPAERYIVEARFPDSGRVALVNRVQALDHFIGSYTAETDTLGEVDVSAERASPDYGSRFRVLRTDAAVSRDIARYRKYFGAPVTHSLVLTMRTRDLPAAVSNMLLGINASVEWNDGMPMMNWVSTGRQVQWILRDPDTGKENLAIHWRFRQGDVVKLRIFNDPSSPHAMDHPIHLHGQRFLVLARDGVANQNLVWKDTALIPAGQTVDLLVDMSNPGRWMLHCHIAEHLGAGMQTVFTVERATRRADHSTSRQE